jgi:hypothetical protein
MCYCFPEAGLTTLVTAEVPTPQVTAELAAAHAQNRHLQYKIVESTDVTAM